MKGLKVSIPYRKVRYPMANIEWVVFRWFQSLIGRFGTLCSRKFRRSQSFNPLQEGSVRRKKKSRTFPCSFNPLQEGSVLEQRSSMLKRHFGFNPLQEGSVPQGTWWEGNESVSIPYRKVRYVNWKEVLICSSVSIPYRKVRYQRVFEAVIFEKVSIPYRKVRYY